MFQSLLPQDQREEFIAEFWDRKSRYTAHGSNFFMGLISVDDIDQLLHVGNLEYGRNFRLVNSRDSSAIPEFSGRDDSQRIASKVYIALSRGCSLNIMDLQDIWGPVQGLCRDFEEAFQFPALCNLYYTPPLEQAFKPHYDGHDVFVLQISGSKRWDIYDRAREAPVAGRGQEIALPPGSEPDCTHLLREGDSLYLPHGFVHQAITGDEASLHLTIGIYAYSFGDLVQASLRHLIEQHAVLRRPLPPGSLWDPDGVGEGSQHQLDMAKTLVLSEFDPAVGFGQLRKAFVSQMRPIAEPHVNQLGNAASVGPGTWVVRKSGMMAIVETDGDRATIVYPGNAVSGPLSIRNCLEHMAGIDAPFRVQDLPGPISLNSRAVLVRQLIREGLLRILPGTVERISLTRSGEHTLALTRTHPKA